MLWAGQSFFINLIDGRVWDEEIMPVRQLLLTPTQPSIIIWFTCSLASLRGCLNTCRLNILAFLTTSAAVCVFLYDPSQVKLHLWSHGRAVPKRYFEHVEIYPDVTSLTALGWQMKCWCSHPIRFSQDLQSWTRARGQMPDEGLRGEFIASLHCFLDKPNNAVSGDKGRQE